MEEYLAIYQTLKKTTLKHIEDADLFINKIIGNYNDTFKIVKIYGTNECPLFVPSEIRDILEVPSTTFENKMKKLRENKHYLQCNYIETYIANGVKKNRTQNSKKLLTKFGLHRIIYISSGEVAELFTEFIDVILSELEKKGKADLEESLQKYKKMIDKLIDEKKEITEHNANLTSIYNQTKVKELLEDDKEYSDYGIDKKYTMAIELYNEKYLIPLYFVDYKTELKELLETKLMPKIKKLVNKKSTKKSKESDSEIEDLQENKETTKSKVKKQFDDNEVQNIIDFILDFINDGENILELSGDDMLKGLMEYYGLNDGEDNIYPGDTSMFEDESKNHVYCIKPTKTKAEKKTYMKIGDLFIANKVHLEELGKALKDHKCPPFGDNAFYAPYNKIVRDAKKVFVDKIYNEKLKEKNVQNAMQVRSSLNKY